MVIYGGLMGLHGGFWWNLMSVGETICLTCPFCFEILRYTIQDINDN